jgi:vanadium chloroperoxidase
MNQIPPLPATVQDGDDRRNYDANYVFVWNRIALDLNRLTHTLTGPQNGPPLSARVCYFPSRRPHVHHDLHSW